MSKVANPLEWPRSVAPGWTRPAHPESTSHLDKITALRRTFLELSLQNQLLNTAQRDRGRQGWSLPQLCD